MATTNIQSFSGDVEVASNLTVDTNTLHVDSVAGRVGIGKTNPAYAVDVNGSLNATSVYLGGTQLESIWTSNISNAYYTTGAIGIGTDFPKKDLEVQGTLRLSNAATGNSTDLLTVDVQSDVFVLEQTLTAPDAAPSDQFGVSVSISNDGSYALVGASRNDGAAPDGGAAYIYMRSGSSWTYQQKITAPDAAGSDSFGYSVSISGDGSYALVGASRNDGAAPDGGAAYIYMRSGSSWTYQQKFTTPDAAAGDEFGWSVAISRDGSYALSGARYANAGSFRSGASYVYVRSGSVWSYQSKLTAPSILPTSYFGYSSSLSSDGSYALVGEMERNGAYVYTRSGTTWSFQSKLSPPDSQADDQFGYTLAISNDGSYAVVGSRAEDQAGDAAGAVYTYVRSGTSWSFQKKIVPTGPAAIDLFGNDVSISDSGASIMIGATGDDDAGTNAGAIYIYNRSGTDWVLEKKITTPGTVNLGSSVSMTGDGARAIGGASGTSSYTGSGYAFAPGDILPRLVTDNAIEADGTLLSFTGQHICFPEGPMSQGMVVSANKNKYVSLNGPLTTGQSAIKSSESLPVVSLSKAANDRSVFGVVDHNENGGTSRTQTSGATIVRSDKELGDNRVVVNSLGEGAMWVANTNGPLESGDYITTSNIAGYGQRQDDDTIHSYTVAKITMDCDFDPEDVPVQIIKKDEDGQNILDQYGRIQWEEVPDQTEMAYKIRYLTTDGRRTDQANAVWKAAYVGCTYHCG